MALAIFRALLPATLQGAQANGGYAGVANGLDGVAGPASAKAMGFSTLATSKGLEGMFGNPAGLSLVDTFEVNFNHHRWLEDINQESAIFGLGGAWGGVALGAHYLGFGTLEGRDSSGNLTNSYGADRWGLDIGWGMEVIRSLTLGLAGGWRQQTIAQNKTYSYLGDIGAIWEQGNGIRVGLALVDLGTSSAGRLDAGATLGLAYTMDQKSAGALLLALNAKYSALGTYEWMGGLEYTAFRAFSIRGGYSRSSIEKAQDTQPGWSLGAGFEVASVALDYAYLPFGDLGSSHWISLAYKFEKNKVSVQKYP